MPPRFWWAVAVIVLIVLVAVLTDEDGRPRP